MPGAVGRLIFRIIGKDETGPASQSAQKNVGGVTAALDKAKLAAAGFAAAGGTALLQFAARAREAAKEVGDASNALQIGVERAGQYAFAARRAGIELNDFTTVLQRLTEIQVVDAKDSETVRTALRRIGIDPDDASFLNATSDELSNFFIQAFQGASAKVASATAEELGITNLDLNALIRVQAEVGTVAGDEAGIIDIDDILAAERIRDIEVGLQERGLQLGQIVNRVLGHVFQGDVETFRDLASVLTGGIVDSTDEIGRKSAEALVEGFNDYLIEQGREGLTERQVVGLADALEEYYAARAAGAGTEASQAFIAAYNALFPNEFEDFKIPGGQRGAFERNMQTRGPLLSPSDSDAGPLGNAGLPSTRGRSTPAYRTALANGFRGTFERWVQLGRPSGETSPTGVTGVGTPQSARGFIDRFGLLNNAQIVRDVAQAGEFSFQDSVVAGPLSGALRGLNDDQLAAVVQLLERLVEQGEGNRTLIR